MVCVVLGGCDRETATSTPPSAKTDRSLPASRPQRAPVETAPREAETASADHPANLSALTAENAPALREDLRKDPAQWRSRLGPFYRAWAILDPLAALESAAGEERLSSGAVIMALSGWAGTDPGAAAEWLASQPPGPRRERHAAGLVQGWPADRLQELADWAAGLSSALEGSGLPVRITARWGHEDPAAAADWLRGLEGGEPRRRATDLLFQQWGAADPTAAGEYLADNPEAPYWDTAASAYSKVVVWDDADGAERWAEAIDDPELRGQIRDALPVIEKSANPGGGPGIPE